MKLFQFFHLNFLGPFFWALLCVFLNSIPFHFLSQYHQSFPIVVIIIFYFAILNPRKLNIYMVFLLGIISDTLSTSVFGMNCFIYSFVFFLSELLRNYVKLFKFQQLWIVFACLFFLTDVVWSWIFRLVSGIWVSASFWFVQFLFMCLLYPLFMWLTGRLFPQEKVEL